MKKIFLNSIRELLKTCYNRQCKGILTLLLIGCVFAGCLETYYQVTIKMEVSLDSTDDFPSTGGSKTLIIKSTTNRWEVSSNADWLTVSPPSTGKEDGRVTLLAAENKSFNELSATITISGKGFTTMTQDIQIAGVTPDLKVSVSSLSFDTSNVPKTFTITSNVSWSIANNLPDWLSVSPMSGSNDATVTVTATTNPSANDRKATITVNGGRITQEISVTQPGDPFLKLSVSSLIFDASSVSQTFNVTSNVSWSIANTLPDWLSVSPMSGSNDATVTVTATTNPSENERNATITVNGGGITQEISVTQPGDKSILYSWDLTNTMKATLNDKGVLTVSTTANAEAMPNFFNISCPWNNVRDNIKSVVILDRVTSIGERSFQVCPLESFTFSGTVRIIGDEAFWGCSLSSLVIPNTITSIGMHAFYRCKLLISVTIPNSVSFIGDYAFSECDILTSINVDVGNTAYSSDAGILYNKNKTVLHSFPAGKTGSFTIPSSVTSVNNGAFGGCAQLSSITIPNSITNIGGWAFDGCSSLTSITIPNSVTSIGTSAFRNCRNFKSVSVAWAKPLNVNTTTFENANISNVTLHVPAGTRALYQADPVWGQFGNIIAEGESNDPFKEDMVFVQGGTFTMGCTDNECLSSELPTHLVTLSDFYIGKYEVTQAQWKAVMDGANPSWFKGDNLPVETVSWNDIVGTSGATMVINNITYYANGFIYKLNQLTGMRYRLPTEAEWEYAARGGRSSGGYKYSGSNTIDDVAWYLVNSGSSTHVVGTKKANELGIFDMSGNVLEWCSDWYGAYNSNAQTNPQGPNNGSDRVNRGGGWYGNAILARVSFHSRNWPDYSDSPLGFRLARSSN